ncbi:hypothetical protein [Yoonia sp. 208BN28-4]|uniref:hypothetical protein n=1 Tax=Yoonia sp. 208BN28-4 TaxID=3126505 RepID=UPI0030AA5C92
MNTKAHLSGGPFALQRVVVTGANGAGKSTFATTLGQRSGLPVLHNDAFALTTRWQRRPRSGVQRAVAQALSAPRWIIEGGPSLIRPDVLAHAPLVIWLDLPRGLRIRRIIGRSLRYAGRTRPEHPAGNRDWPGVRQVRFVAGAWRDAGAYNRAISEGLGSYPVTRLTSPQAISAFLDTVETAGEGTKLL